MEKKIVFCGGGNMAEGILRSILKAEVAEPELVTVSEPVEDRRVYLEETYGVMTEADASDEFETAEIIIIAVTPNIVPVVTKSLDGKITGRTMILSIAAGIPIAALEEQLGKDKKIARVIPNTLNQVKEGYSAYALNENCGEKEKEDVEEILGALGQVMPLKEDLFNAFSTFACAGPLWVYKEIEALINAGVYSGFSRQDARKIVLKNMQGAAKVLELTGEHPAVKVDQMTSPGGVTIEALKTLEDCAFDSAILKSVKAGIDKADTFDD